MMIEEGDNPEQFTYKKVDILYTFVCEQPMMNSSKEQDTIIIKCDK